MPFEQALLRDILDCPDDDLPRLVYADWLDDYGGPAGALRAELIRLQITLAGAVEPERRPALEAQVNRLLKRHQGQWLGALRPHLHAWTFQRGFLHHVALDAAAWLEYGGAIVEAHPVASAHLHNARAHRAMLARLAECPFMARLRCLDLSGNFLEEADCRALFASPHLGGLRALRCNDNPFGYDAVRALADAPELSGLLALELKRNNLTEATVMALADSPYLVGLKALDLRGNAVGEHGRSQLRDLFGAGVVRF
jgi:uncharacterized protein (TIGR02996 family)